VIKILTVVGARPQFIKAAPVSRALRASGRIEEILVHTGQHYDPEMSDIFFDELAIPAPNYHLEVHGGGHGQMTGRMLEALEPVVERERPDVMLIYGDTNSTLAGAIVAAKCHVPVAHVEAGLRSFNRRMPEEVNRVLADHVSTWLLCPTTAAIDNLAREGIKKGVHHVGDVMFDATLYARERARERSDILEKLQLRTGAFLVATVHRAENTDDQNRLREVLNWLRNRAVEIPVVLPLHPRTRARAEAAGLDFVGLRTCAPLGYLDMVRLLDACVAVYTDSGGLQKEAYFHRKPCVTLRDETEWVETVACGWNRLWKGPDYLPRCDITEYGDGSAANRITEILLSK
jgi:UDP-GlcNAc3NAcA epimerase